MEAVTVTAIKGGWWLPGRALKTGEVLTLDAATAEGLALRGIVRIEQPRAEPEPTRVAPNAGKTSRRKNKEADV